MKKLIIFGVAAVIALASLSVGYALWSKTLDISGTVTTGNVDVVYVDTVSPLSPVVVEDEQIENLDPLPDADAPGDDDGSIGDDADNTVEGKDIGSCTAEVTPAAPGVDALLEITVGTGYPSFDCWTTFQVQSTGSIPVHIYQPVFTGTGNDWAGFVDLDLVSCFEDNTQLHQTNTASCTVHTHVRQQAAQGATYHFAGEIEARQYNEPRGFTP